MEDLVTVHPVAQADRSLPHPFEEEELAWTKSLLVRGGADQASWGSSASVECVCVCVLHHPSW